MAIWLPLILFALQTLLTWLIKAQKTGRKLTADESESIDHVLEKMDEVKVKIAQMRGEQ